MKDCLCRSLDSITKDREAQYQTGTSTLIYLGSQEKRHSITSPHEPYRVQYLGNRDHRGKRHQRGKNEHTSDSCDYPCLIVRGTVDSAFLPF